MAEFEAMCLCCNQKLQLEGYEASTFDAELHEHQKICTDIQRKRPPVKFPVSKDVHTVSHWSIVKNGGK